MRILFILFLIHLFCNIYADSNKLAKKENPKVVSVEINLDYKSKNYKLLYTGAIVSEKGYAIIPFLYDKNSITDARLWYKQTEYSASVVDIDKQVNIALLKFEPDSKVEFFTIYPQPILKRTKTLNITTSSSEENFFNQYTDSFHFLGYYFGQIDCLVTSSLNINDFFLTGSVVTDQEGNLTGILSDGRNRVILASYDINKQIKRMLKRTSDKNFKKQSEDKPYLGFTRFYTNKDFAEAKKLPVNSMTVTAVFKESPAEKSGLKVGDLIIAIDKISLQGTNQNVEKHFTKLLNPEVGENIEFQILRDGKYLTIDLTFEKQPVAKELKVNELGLTIKDIQQENIYVDEIYSDTGVLVTKIEPGSPAAISNEFSSSLLLKNDVILAINDTPIHSIQDISDNINNLRNNKKNIVLMKILRGINTKFVAMKFKLNEDQNEK